MESKNKDNLKKGSEILTTEQCSRCRHPLYKNTATGEKICKNCGLRTK